MSFFNQLEFFSISYITLSLGLIIIAISGILLNNKSLLILMLNIELMFLGLSILILRTPSIEYYCNAQIYTLLILCVSAAESAIGLSLIIIAYNKKRTILFAAFNEIKL